MDLSRGVMLQQIMHWNTLPRDIRSMAGSKDFFEKDSCLMHFYLYSIPFSSFLNFNLMLISFYNVLHYLIESWST